MKRTQVHPNRQLVLPTIDRLDVFAGTLYLDSHASKDGYWDKDCATQCILNITKACGFDVTYEDVASALRKRKRIEDAEPNWSHAYRDAWMESHLSPCMWAIYEALEELTGVQWYWVEPKKPYTLQEYAWEFRCIDVMAVSTKRHITAVLDGVVYDFWNSLHKTVISTLYPVQRLL